MLPIIHEYGIDLDIVTFLLIHLWQRFIGFLTKEILGIVFPFVFASWVLALSFDITLAASRPVVVFCFYAESSGSLHLLYLVFLCDMR